jgi:Xaa-Pro aminopeptidase
MAASGFSGFLVSYLPNLQYLTAFSGSNGRLLLSEQEALFFTDARYEQQAGEEIPPDADIEILIFRDCILKELAQRAGRLFGGAPAAFEGQHLSYADWTLLRDESGSVQWESSPGLVERLRSVKDDDEIAFIARAVEIASEALRQTLPIVRPGVREIEVAAELDYRMTRLGSEGPAFETIVAGGARSALPHAKASQRRLELGDLVLCDFGARWRTYCSDLTRTFVLGEPTSRQRETYDRVRAAQREALGVLREGASGADVDAAVRASLAEAGLEARFSHSTGHGLGLEVHEGPKLGRRVEEPLDRNMVVTVEPGVYFPGWGGIRIEDDVVVTEGQPRVLGDLDKDQLLGLPV